MAALNECALAIVTSIPLVDMKTAGATSLYTVPVGKIFYPFSIIVRVPSASLAGGTEYDFGIGANCDTWKQNVDLSSLTAVTDYIIVTALTKFQNCVAGSVFGIKVITGATGAATATVDVIGYLVDA